VSSAAFMAASILSNLSKRKRSQDPHGVRRAKGLRAAGRVDRNAAATHAADESCVPLQAQTRGAVTRPGRPAGRRPWLTRVHAHGDER
jgi:hypothetical protein